MVVLCFKTCYRISFFDYCYKNGHKSLLPANPAQEDLRQIGGNLMSTKSQKQII